MNATTTPPHTTRESWLTAAADELWPIVVKAGGKRPESCRYSCGWPSKSALMRAGSGSRRIGEAWHAGSDDGSREIFVTPALADAIAVLDVLGHELVHAALEGGAGHGPLFQRVCTGMGWEKKQVRSGKSWRAAGATDATIEDVLKPLAKRLGKYPHAKLDASFVKRDKNRQMLCECPDCGFKFRTTRMWIDTYLPTCGCGTAMVSVDYQPEGEALELLEAVVSYQTEDGRFSLSTSKHGRREGRWVVRENFRPFDADSGELVEAALGTTPSDRWCYRLTRTDALSFIAAVRTGETDFPEPELDEPDDEAELDDDIGDWSASDADLYLDDDEDEEHDYPEDELTDDEVEDYELTAARRDASGTATSLQIIAAGGQGAMD